MAAKTIQKTKAAGKAGAAAPARKSAKVAVKPAAKPAPKVVPAKASSKPAAKPAGKSAEKSTEKAVVAAPVAKRSKCPLDARTLAQVREALIKTRDRLTGQITALADDTLKYIDDTSSEDRTDDFDREFALNLVSSEHDAVFEIDNALRRIAEGVYGVCDMCGCPIEKARLLALPFARNCVKCQSENERGRTRFRPFGETLAQGTEPAQEPSEVEETE